MKKDFGSAVSFLAAMVLTLGCASRGTSTGADNDQEAGAKGLATAVAVLAPATNGPVKGQVTFTEETQGVRVTANITGLTPGKHGFHIHEKGDCSAPDFTSAGGHWNPLNAKHGAPTSGGTQHHFGDFGNVEANDQGVVRFERVFQWLSFTGTNSFLGRAVVVHAKADDLTSQPAGDAGARIACGVIRRVPAK
jgi:Cu-Zn family superoxide dismutase